MKDQVHSLRDNPPRDMESIVAIHYAERGRPVLATAVYEEEIVWFDILYLNIVKFYGEDKFTHWMLTPEKVKYDA